MKIGTDSISLRLGSVEIPKAYLGSELVHDAYRRLDYLQGITKDLETDIQASGSQWTFDLVCDSLTSSNEVFASSGTEGGHFAAACSNGMWGLGTGNGFYTSVPVTTRSTIIISFTTKGISMTIGNESANREGTSDHTRNISLFGGNNGQFLFAGKIYSVKCTSGGTFDGVPVQRISDGKNGIYDTVNNVFYPLT